MSQHHLITFWQGRTENAYREMILAKQENELLQAENERLRKAGDAMDAYLKRQDGTTNGMLYCRVEWANAKGVQS